MDIVICDECNMAMVYAMKDIDGVNLEEVYECECGNCIAYDDAKDLFTLCEGEVVDYQGRHGTLKKIDKHYSLVYFPDVDETQELLNSDIAWQMI